MPLFQNLFVCSACGPNRSRARGTELDFWWMLSEVWLLKPDLFTLALKQVEMSHLTTFKLRTTEDLSISGRILYIKNGRILYLRRSLPVLNALFEE